MSKRVIGNINNHQIVVPKSKATPKELIIEDGYVKWGACNHPYKIKESDVNSVGKLNNRRILAHADNKVKSSEYAIDEDGLLLKRKGSALEPIVEEDFEDLIKAVLLILPIRGEQEIEVSFPNAKKFWLYCLKHNIDIVLTIAFENNEGQSNTHEMRATPRDSADYYFSCSYDNGGFVITPNGKIKITAQYPYIKTFWRGFQVIYNR